MLDIRYFSTHKDRSDVLYSFWRHWNTVQASMKVLESIWFLFRFSIISTCRPDSRLLFTHSDLLVDVFFIIFFYHVLQLKSPPDHLIVLKTIIFIFMVPHNSKREHSFICIYLFSYLCGLTVFCSAFCFQMYFLSLRFVRMDHWCWWWKIILFHSSDNPANLVR